MTDPTPTPTLGDRQAEILALVSRGYQRHEIAKQLWLSETTVKSTMQAICRKLGCRNSAHAVGAAARLGLLR